MTPRDDFDLSLTAWLGERAERHAPPHLMEVVVARTTRTRPRPAWRIPERWIPMPLTLRLAVVPRVVLILLLLAAMLATVVTGAVVGGRLHLLGAAAVLPPTGPAGNGLIAYESGGDIWVVNPDGTDKHLLTTTPGLEHSPAWSADGTRLAYWSQEALGTPPTVMTINADGSEAMTVATHDAVPRTGADFPPRRDVWPDPYRLDWSPDGTHLAYSLGWGADERIYVAAADGTGTSAIGDSGLTAWFPDWSPDGTLLAFGGSRGGVETGAYVMAPDGTGVRRLSQVKDDDQYAFVELQWSPDGTSIATQAWNIPANGWDTWVVAADGSGERVIGHGITPKWSPDGWWVSHRGGTTGLTVVARDGSEARELDLGVGDKQVIWSPDGTAFATLGSGGLAVIDAVTGEVRAEIAVPDQIANHLNYPSWQRVAR
jgi:Tol biopolymer transport system component